MIASQTKIAREQMASSSVEPAHNDKISMRSPSSNAKMYYLVIYIYLSVFIYFYIFNQL